MGVRKEFVNLSVSGNTMVNDDKRREEKMLKLNSNRDVKEELEWKERASQ